MLTGRPARPALPSRLRIPLAVSSAVALVVLVVLAVRFAGHSEPSAFDAWTVRVTAWSASDPYDPRTPVWLVATAGDPPVAAVLVLILVVLCWWLGNKRLAVLAVAGTIVTGGVSTVLKPIIGRTINGGYLSYPSGHTAFLTGVGLVTGLLLADRLRTSRAGAVVLVLGCATVVGAVEGWAQAASVIHYATDTIGGFCTALVLFPSTAWLIDRFAPVAIRTAGRRA